MSGFGVASWQLEGSAAHLRQIAEGLAAQLRALERDATDLLAGWQGELGSVVASRWRLWHRAASEVIAGLDLVAQLLDETARAYTEAERASVAS